MTVSDDGEDRRYHLSPEDRARLKVEAWRLKDKGWSYRRIEKHFTDRGDKVSHTTVGNLIKEAREQAQYLDLIEPAQVRADQLGYLDGAISRCEIAIETGTIEFEKGMKLLVQLIRLQKEISGSAMPTRMQVETTNEMTPTSVATIRAFADEIDRWERNKAAPPEGYERNDT